MISVVECTTSARRPVSQSNGSILLQQGCTIACCTADTCIHTSHDSSSIETNINNQGKHEVEI
jgi:hypothetical protein